MPPVMGAIDNHVAPGRHQRDDENQTRDLHQSSHRAPPFAGLDDGGADAFRGTTRSQVMRKSVRPIPEGHRTVSTYLIINDAAAALDFYGKAFGAVELMRH